MATLTMQGRPATNAAEARMLRDYRERLARELAELDRQISAMAKD